MFDAETGEPLNLTKSRWNSKEGRVNLDYQGITRTGTGHLNIHNPRINRTIDDNLNRNGDGGETKTQSNDSVHPLTEKFLSHGPLNPFFHRYWNPKAGKVEFPTEGTKSKRKKKRKKAKLILDDGLNDDESVNKEKIILDPLAFFNQKKKLGGIVDMALQQRNSIIAIPPLSPPSSSPVPSSSSSIKSTHPPILPPLLSSTTKEDDQLSLTSSEIIPNEQQIIFNQIYSMMSELDDLTHPKPFHLQSGITGGGGAGGAGGGGLTREEKLKWINFTNERKLTIVNQCEEISKLKYRIVRELKQAISDEEMREKKREMAMNELRNPNSKIGRELNKRHKDERERGRLYIRQLQYDNEVLFLTKVREYNLLW